MEFVTGYAVKPVQGSPVFIPKLGRDPNYGDGRKSSGIGKQLSQMPVISSFDLIFNQDPCLVVEFFAEDIRPERTYFLFLCFDFQFQPQDFGK